MGPTYQRLQDHKAAGEKIKLNISKLITTFLLL